MGILSTILGGVTGPIATYLTRRMEIKAQEHQNQLELVKAQGERQAKLASEGLTADANWEMEFAKQAATSWKDEYVLILLSIPLILVFFPFSQAAVLAGFATLAKCPEWYRWLTVMVFGAIYGIRVWRRSQSDT